MLRKAPPIPDTTILSKMNHKHPGHMAGMPAFAALQRGTADSRQKPAAAPDILRTGKKEQMMRYMLRCSRVSR